MKKKDEIKIVSGLRSELITGLEFGGKKYRVITESERPHIITRIYLGGEIVSVRKSDYGKALRDMAGASELGKQHAESFIHDRMREQHALTVKSFREEKLKEEKTPSDYIEEAKNLLRAKRHKEAFALLSEGLESYPGDPFILSYKGCLDAVLNKNYTRGINACREAIKALKGRLPFGIEFFYPVFYLNLGRAYLAADMKKEAIEAFKAGLKSDRENSDIIWELKKLGARRAPAVSFLKRSNPINRAIGKILHKLSR